MECPVIDEVKLLSDNIETFELRLRAQQPITLDEIRDLEHRTEPFKRGPHYQLSQRVRRLARRLGHLDSAQWEQARQAPAPVFNYGERAYIGRLSSTKGAPVELKVVYDHLFLTTNHLAVIGAYDLVKITHRFNREGRLDLIDARLKQTKRFNEEPAEPREKVIFHLLQTFAFKDKLPDPAWNESRCEYFIRIRQLAPLFYDRGLHDEEQHYRFLVQEGHRLMKELHEDVRCRSLRDVRVVRPPFFAFHDLLADEAAHYIIGKAAQLKPRLFFDPSHLGGHLGDLRIKYGAA